MSTGLIDPQLHLPKRKHSKLSQIQEKVGEEEMAQVEILEVEIVAIMDRGML